MKKTKKFLLLLAVLPLLLAVTACDDSSSGDSGGDTFVNVPCDSSPVTNEEFLGLYLETQQSLMTKVYAWANPPLGSTTISGDVSGTCDFTGTYASVVTDYNLYQDYQTVPDGYDMILDGTSTTSISLGPPVDGTTTGTITITGSYPGSVELHLSVDINGPDGGYYMVTQDGCEPNKFYHNDL